MKSHCAALMGSPGGVSPPYLGTLLLPELTLAWLPCPQPRIGAAPPEITA